MSFVNVRPATAADVKAVARVQSDSWRAAYAGIVPDEAISAMTHENREAFWKGILETATGTGPKAKLHLVAEVEGAVTGFAGCGPSRRPDLPFDAELYSVYVLPESQRKGVGRDLAWEAVRWLAMHGHASLLAWVPEANSNGRAFLESLGGVRAGATKEVNISGRVLVEVAYGWRDLSRVSR
jgi:GNAT superfamily N-acetyltransferase